MAEGHSDTDDGFCVVASDLADDRITLSGAKARTLLRRRDHLAAAYGGSCNDDAIDCAKDAPLSEGSNPPLHPHGWRHFLARLENQDRPLELLKRRQPVSHRQLVDNLDAPTPSATGDLVFRPSPCPRFCGFSLAEFGQGAGRQPIGAEVLRLSWLHDLQFSTGEKRRPQRREMDVIDLRAWPEVNLS